MQHKVTLSVDGVIVTETVAADDGEKAIKKAKEKHPVYVVSVVPLEEQLGLDEPGDHPGQTSTDDFMEKVGEALEEEAPSREVPEPAHVRRRRESEEAGVSLDDLEPSGEAA